MKLRKQLLTCALGLGVLTVTLACQSGDSDADAAMDSVATAPAPAVTAPSVMIHEPAEGAELAGDSVNITLMASNLTISVAGDTTPGTGHHHLFINTPVVNPGEAIPTGNPNIVHLGKAQTSHALLKLPPGEYTVIAVLGDAIHRRIDPQVLDTVRFRVK
jgi:hypothetical protein